MVKATVSGQYAQLKSTVYSENLICFNKVHNSKGNIFEYEYLFSLMVEQRLNLLNAPISVKPRGGEGGGRATHGNLTVTYIPRVGILIGHNVPRVGNFGMVAILDNGESLETISAKVLFTSSRKEGNHLLLFCDQCFNTICYKQQKRSTPVVTHL